MRPPVEAMPKAFKGTSFVATSIRRLRCIKVNFLFIVSITLFGLSTHHCVRYVKPVKATEVASGANVVTAMHELIMADSPLSVYAARRPKQRIANDQQFTGNKIACSMRIGRRPTPAAYTIKRRLLAMANPRSPFMDCIQKVARTHAAAAPPMRSMTALT